MVNARVVKGEPGTIFFAPAIFAPMIRSFALANAVDPVSAKAAGAAGAQRSVERAGCVHSVVLENSEIGRIRRWIECDRDRVASRFDVLGVVDRLAHAGASSGTDRQAICVAL